MMKKILAAAACAAMVLSLAGCGSNENAPDAPKGINWSSVPYADEKDFENKDVADGVMIKKYIGNDTVVNIPPTIGGKQVVCIGVYAFQNRTSLTSVAIPNSVTTINSAAFLGCASLTSITIPDRVTKFDASVFGGCTSLEAINVDPQNPNFCSVDGVVFNKDKTVLLIYPSARPASSYVIPDGVTEIRINSFNNCQNLTSVTIPDSMTKIEPYSFFSPAANDPHSIQKYIYKGNVYDSDHFGDLNSAINGN